MKYLSFRVFMTLLLVASFKQAFADEMELLFGDTHLHTAYSFDAFLNDGAATVAENNPTSGRVPERIGIENLLFAFIYNI